MRLLASTVFVTVLPLFCNVGVSYANEAEPSPQVVKLFGGRENFDVMHEASEVFVVRLKRKPEHPPSAGMDAYERVGKEWTFNEATRREMIAMFSSDASYLWDQAVGCIPDYGYRINFRRGDDVLCIAVCLECRMICIFRDDKRVGCEEFDPVLDKLKRFVDMLP